MTLERIIGDVVGIVDESVYSNDTRPITDLRGVLRALVELASLAETAIQAQRGGNLEDADSIMNRVDAMGGQLAIDASAMQRPAPAQRVPTIDDAPIAEPVGAAYMRELEAHRRGGQS